MLPQALVLSDGLLLSVFAAGHDISADAHVLVAQLLQRDPSKRLGNISLHGIWAELCHTVPLDFVVLLLKEQFLCTSLSSLW
jgi:hypothetical protein